MATRLVVLDRDPDTLDICRRIGEAKGLEVIAEVSSVERGADAPHGDLAVIALAAFSSPGALRSYVEASAPDSVLLLIADDADLDALGEQERRQLAGIAPRPLTPALAAAHLEGMGRRRDDRLRRDATLSALPDMVFHLSRDGRYLDCYPRDHAALVASPEVFIGHHMCDVLPPPIRVQAERAIEAALQTQSAQTFKYALKLPGIGDVGHFEARVAVSGPDEVLVIVRDITDITRAEDGLKHAAAAKQALASRLLHVQESERHHLARELHDAIGQMLLVHKLEAEWLRTRATSVEWQKASGALARGLAETLEMVRSLARGLRPPALDDLGLGPALEMLAGDIARRSPCRVMPDLQLASFDIRAEAEVTLYRIAQEALTNAIKHARCRQIWIRLERDRAGAVTLHIEDDGDGISEAEARSRNSLGLASMHERAALHDGEVIISPRPGGGTAVIARIPDTTKDAHP